MRKKVFEIMILDDFVSIQTDDFSCCFEGNGGGVQGANVSQEQALEKKYRKLGKLAMEIAKSPHSNFQQLRSYIKKSGEKNEKEWI